MSTHLLLRKLIGSIAGITLSWDSNTPTGIYDDVTVEKQRRQRLRRRHRRSMSLSKTSEKKKTVKRDFLDVLDVSFHY